MHSDIPKLNLELNQDCDKEITEKEILLTVLNTLIREGLHVTGISVVRAMRLESREGKPGLVKIQVNNLDEKKKLLKHKQHLKQSGDYSNVFLRSSKPHLERLVDLNFKTMLSLVPGGQNFRITGSGRIVPKDGQQQPGLQNNMVPGAVGGVQGPRYGGAQGPGFGGGVQGPGFGGAQGIGFGGAQGPGFSGMQGPGFGGAQGPGPGGRGGGAMMGMNVPGHM